MEETNFNNNASEEAELLEWKRETDDAGKRALGNGTDDGGACAEEEEEKEKKQKQLKSSMLVPDGVVEEEDVENIMDDDEKRATAQNTLHNPNACYCCKKRFTEVHHFYASMCPSCAEENYFRRHFTCDMRGRYCIVTGARVKIGFRVALKLLKAGAFVVATTRFPEDARERFKRTDEELLKQIELSFSSHANVEEALAKFSDNSIFNKGNGLLKGLGGKGGKGKVKGKGGEQKGAKGKGKNQVEDVVPNMEDDELAQLLDAENEAELEQLMEFADAAAPARPVELHLDEAQ